eukprot:15086775-Alexandrium_andersonii.AAC.1
MQGALATLEEGNTYVAVADGHRNELMRSVRRSTKDGPRYYKSPSGGKWVGGANVSHALAAGPG